MTAKEKKKFNVYISCFSLKSLRNLQELELLIYKINMLRKQGLHPKLFLGRISPHTLRHSKAMHLLEGGVNLIYIRDFLGHTSVITTEIYAKLNPEIKRKAIEKASPNILPLEKYSEKDKEEMIESLKTIILKNYVKFEADIWLV